MPVTTPGSAIGRMTTKERASRPKKRYLCTAKAISVPSTSATPVAPSPARIEVHRAERAPLLCQASDHQCSVRCDGGQPKPRSALTELTRTSSNGR